MVAAEQAPQAAYIGQPMRRKEDDRFLRGRGLFVADVRVPEVLDAAVLRSPHANARIKSVDVSLARSAPGVHAVLTYHDLPPALQQTLPMFAPNKALTNKMPYALARDKVTFVGEPVAIVVADSRYLAEDATELIGVDYESLPAVTNVEQALLGRPGLVHEDVPNNIAAALPRHAGTLPPGAADGRRISLRFDFPRASAQPMETRGVLASPGRTSHTPSLTVWDSTQMPHTSRRVMADLLGLPQHAVHLILTDVGGGFGTKNRFYQEEILVAHLALMLGRSVRWIEDRLEDLCTTYQSRDQVHNATVTFDEEGRVLSLEDHILADQGSYTPHGMVLPWNTTSGLAGLYRIPRLDVDLKVVFTNKPGIVPYRAGAGPPAVLVLERMMDRIAVAVGKDPIEVRRLNILKPADYPYSSGLVDRDGATPMVYDSGVFYPCLEDGLKLLGYDDLRREQAELRTHGRYRGIGMACYIENGGRGFEGVVIRVESTGRVLVATGSANQGQAHETVWAQVCAERLGVRFDDIEVVNGDTALVAMGMGTYASRSAVLTSNAVRAASLAVREKVLRAAARLLEADEADLDLSDSVIRVRGVPGRSVTLADVARTVNAASPALPFPKGLQPGLEETVYWKLDAGGTSGGGAHIAVVDVDVDTGRVDVLRYLAVHDCGQMLNPLVVEGQVHGATAQGLGTALLEDVVYDNNGQLLSANFMDYMLPTSMDVPSFEDAHRTTLADKNPEGVRPVGEGGAIPVPAVIANAVEDALRPFGVVVTRVPLTPEYVWSLISRRHGGSPTPAG